MDLVYFYRHVHPQEQVRSTDELRYSLRSMVAHYAELGEVHVFGGRAPWFSGHVHHYPVRQGYTKHENTWRIWGQIASAARSGYLADDFLIMNDDYFLTRPLPGPVPTYVSGTLDEWIGARAQSTLIVDTIERTQRMIAELGGPAPAEQLGFELHVPLVAHGPTLAALWPRLDAWTRGGKMANRIAKRSAYGNLAGTVGPVELMPTDCKVIRAGDPMPDGPWLSTSDESFMMRNVHPIGPTIRAMFPRPSRFESPVSATLAATARTVRSDTPLHRRVAPR
jgi:hypothetical protein